MSKWDSNLLNPTQLNNPGSFNLRLALKLPKRQAKMTTVRFLVNALQFRLNTHLHLTRPRKRSLSSLIFTSTASFKATNGFPVGYDFNIHRCQYGMRPFSLLPTEQGIA